jgi:hypothetical protein
LQGQSSRSPEGHIGEGDDLEEFLNGSDGWDDDSIEPVVKKRKT